uniref:Apoptosis-associated tyrosine kinase b n=1 Tax=Cynoglossus semilaevis TaxID=244447 RepID=A0A3P8UJH3_CYNSE
METPVHVFREFVLYLLCLCFRSLGVTIWELFEFGNQPYRNYTDRQVLAYTVKEQQLRLKIPLLRVPLAERWYEVMQFCWLQPEQRPTAEEVHLLLTYLCAKGASEAEEDFERRWNSMCPNTGHHRPSALSQDHPSLSSSSFPLLEQFSAGDGYHSGDDVLTVTETSQGLNFEYKWEQARAQQICRPPESSCSLGQVDHRCPDTFYPPGGIMGSCALESLSHGVSSSYYEPKHLHAPGVLPVLSAHSPSVNSEYYIRIEEPVGCPMDPDYTIGSYSPEYQGSSGSFLTGSADSGECVSCPSLPTTNMGSYWSAEIHRSEIYDSSDSSPAISLTMEPLLGHVTHNSPLRAWESSHYVSYKDRDGGYYFENSPPLAVDPYLMGDEQSSIEHLQESWGSRSLRQALGELEHPLGLMPSVGSPPDLAYRDPYLDTGQTSIIGKNLTGGYYDMMGSLRKTMPSHTRHNSHSVSINMETEGALYIGHRDSESEEEDVEDVFVERHTCNTWPSKHHHSRKGQHRRTSHSCRQDTYVDFHYTMPSTDIEDSWPKDHSLVYHSLPRPIHYPEPRHAKDNSACLNLSKHSSMPSSENFPTYIYLCHEDEPPAPPPGQCCHSHFVDPLAGLLVRNSSYTQSKPVKDKMVDVPSGDEMINLSPAPGGPHVPKTTVIKTDEYGEQYIDLGPASTRFRETKEDIIKENPIMQKPPEPKVEDVTLTMNKMIAPPAENVQVMMVLVDPQSEVSQTGDSGLGQDSSSTGLVDILDCSDDEEDEDITEDITDVTSGIFVDDSSELNASPALKSLQKQVGTPDSMDSIDLPPGVCEGFSPGSSHPSSSPKALDSGYNTENNQSPEFVLKEPHETTEDSQGAPTPDPGHQGPHEEPQEEQKEEKEDQPEVVSEEEQREKVEEEEQKKENNQEEEEEEDKLGVDATVLSHSSLSLDEDVSQTGDHIFLPLSDKTPYRDSAYFSDYENERVLKDEGAEEQSEVTEEQIKEPEGEQMNNKNEEKSEEPSAAGTEEAEDEEGSKFAQTASPIEEEDDWPSQEETSSLGDWAAEVVVAMEEALGALNEGGSLSSEVEKKKEGGARAESSKTSAPTKETVSRSSHHRTSAETLHALPKDEVALQHSANARRFSSSSSTPPSTPPPPLGVTDGQGPSANGEEWNEEQRANSDDSDDSDEELQSYAVQEESEDDEECHLVPIVVSDDSHVHTLRSLLKTPTTLVADSQEEALKKTVSFFDDVTVYLFDQESPTQELTENCFLLETEGQRSENSSKEKLNTSDDSSDGNVSEESKSKNTTQFHSAGLKSRHVTSFPLFLLRCRIRVGRRLFTPAFTNFCCDVRFSSQKCHGGPPPQSSSSKAGDKDVAIHRFTIFHHSCL